MTASTRSRHGQSAARWLTLAYEELAITAEPGLVLLVYTAEPGSRSADRLRLLASWAAPVDSPTSGG